MGIDTLKVFHFDFSRKVCTAAFKQVIIKLVMRILEKMESYII